MITNKIKVPLIKADLPALEEIEFEFKEILKNGKITNFGKYVQEFESETSKYLGTNTISVSSGTVGLLFAIQALTSQKKKNVIVPSFTFVATVQAALYAGLTPLFADVNDELTMCTKDLEFLLNEHRDVAVITPVHTYGMPCKVNEIQNLASNIPVVYDAAHAFGGKINEKKIGCFGDAEVFSLSVTKSLVSVEGGLVTSSNGNLIERIKKMRNYGIESNYNATYPGLNGKMSEFHAIIGLKNLKNIETVIKTRQEKAKKYQERIESETSFRLVTGSNNTIHTYKDFTILVPQKLKDKRDEIINFLKNEGVETRAYFYPPVHEQTYFRKYANRALPKTEDYSRRVITLPFYTSITDEEVEMVTQALKKAWHKLT